MTDNMGISLPDPGFGHVHLQWFAEDTEEGGEVAEHEEENQEEEIDIEDKVTNLEKNLTNLRKDLKGKDRAIDRLVKEKQALETKKTKEKERERRRSELEDMSAEELKREIDRREEEIKSEYELEMRNLQEKYKQNEYVQAVYRTAPEIENLPQFVIKLLTFPKDADEDKLKEVMETVRDEVNALVAKNRFVLGQRDKVGPTPQTGGVSTSRIPTLREWERMGEEGQREWAKNATDDQLKKVQESQYK